MLRRDDRALWVVGALRSGCIATEGRGGVMGRARGYRESQKSSARKVFSELR
jgi:hypothetical protein